MPRWKALPQDLDPAIQEFVEQLRRLVDRGGLGIASLSDRTGYSRTSWERYLSGRLLAPKGAVLALAEVTNTPPIHLSTMWELAERAWSRSEARHDMTMEAIRISQARAALGMAEPLDGPGAGLRSDSGRSGRRSAEAPARKKKDARKEARASAAAAPDGEAGQPDAARTGAPTGAGHADDERARDDRPDNRRADAGRSQGGAGQGEAGQGGAEQDGRSAGGAGVRRSGNAAAVGSGSAAHPGAGAGAGSDRGASRDAFFDDRPGGPDGDHTFVLGGAALRDRGPSARGTFPHRAPDGSPFAQQPGAAPGVAAAAGAHDDPGTTRIPRQGRKSGAAAPSPGAAGAPPAGGQGAPAPGGPAGSGGRPRRRSPLLMILAAVLVVAIAAVVTVRFTRGNAEAGSDPKPPPSPTASTLPEGVECSGKECAGRDPEAMGCGGEWVETVGSIQVGTALVEVRWSETCGAAWARITTAQAGDGVRITGPAGGKQNATVNTTTDAYTPMVQASDPAEVTACGTLATGEEACTD